MLLLQIFRHGAVASVSGAGGNVGVPGCQVAWLVDEDVELLIRFSADMHFCQEGAEAARARENQIRNRISATNRRLTVITVNTSGNL